MEFPAREIKVDEVMLQLRAELERSLTDAPEVSSLPTATPSDVESQMNELPEWVGAGDGLPPFPAADHYDVRQFLDRHDVDFVRCAYIGVLGRNADPDGENYYLEALRAGRVTKADVLGGLRYSVEGRKRGVKVAGLALRVGISRFYTVPVLGYLARLVAAWVRLPITLSQGPRLEAFVMHQATLTGRRLDEVVRLGGSNRLASERAAGKARESLRQALAALVDALGERAATSEDLTRVGDELRDGLDAIRVEAEERAAGADQRVERLERQASEVARAKDLARAVGQISRLTKRLDALSECSANRRELVLTTDALGQRVESVRAQAAERLAAVDDRLDRQAHEAARAEDVTHGLEQVSRLAARIDGVVESSVKHADLMRETKALRQELGRELTEARHAADQEMAALHGALERLSREGASALELSQAVEQVSDLERRFEDAMAGVAGREDLARAQGELSEALEGLRAEAAERLVSMDERVERQAQEGARAEHVSAALEQLSRLAERVDGLAERSAERCDISRLEDELRQDLEREVAELRGDTENLFAGLSSDDDHTRDATYSSLEDRFRGSREEILQRLEVYLPIAKKAWESCDHARMVDLGCGRGEWLEHAASRGWSALGVDTNRVMLQRCAEQGFEAREMDALGFLQSCEDASLSVVTAFHVIEHVSFPVLTSLLDEAHRALAPGGVLICETPNPENLIVGSCNFYTDPTHRNPLYPATLEFLYDDRGFVAVEGLRPNPPPEPEWLRALPASNPLAEHLNPLLNEWRQWVLTSPDYACIGRKA